VGVYARSWVAELGAPSFGNGVRGYNPRKIFEIQHAKSCNLVQVTAKTEVILLKRFIQLVQSIT